MELIKDNYLRGSGNGNTWHVDIDPPKQKVKSYFEETISAAEYVHANKIGKIHLLYSGGLDSQYVFNVFQKLRFDFTPVIIRLVGKDQIDYNAHETKYAFEHCAKYNIVPTVINFDYDEFVYSGECFELAKEIRSGTHRLVATLKVAGNIDGFTVFGNDPPYLKYNIERNVWQLEEQEVIHSLLNFYRMRNIQGCPFLLSYTPEMMLSFLLDPYIVNLANGKYPGKQGTNSSKVHVFNNGSGFNMPNYNFINNIKPKYAGYEIIDTTNLMCHPNMLEFNKIKNQWTGIYYEDYQTVVSRLSINQ